MAGEVLRAGQLAAIGPDGRARVFDARLANFSTILGFAPRDVAEGETFRPLESAQVELTGIGDGGA